MIWRVTFWTVVVFMFIMFFYKMLMFPALAHNAPLGWSYGWECCNTKDCRQVPDGAIKEGPEGYIVPTGEVVSYNDKKRVKRSRDQFFHWCTRGGKDDTATICVYVPDRGF